MDRLTSFLFLFFMLGHIQQCCYGDEQKEEPIDFGSNIKEQLAEGYTEVFKSLQNMYSIDWFCFAKNCEEEETLMAKISQKAESVTNLWNEVEINDFFCSNEECKKYGLLQTVNQEAKKQFENVAALWNDNVVSLWNDAAASQFKSTFLDLLKNNKDMWLKLGILKNINEIFWKYKSSQFNEKAFKKEICELITKTLTMGVMPNYAFVNLVNDYPTEYICEKMIKLLRKS